MSKVKGYNLIIDTSKPEAWVALVRDDQVVAEASWVADKTLGTELLQRIQAMMDETGTALGDITRLGVHVGPGHFSALRSGMVTATMVVTAVGCELVELKGDTRAAFLDQLQYGLPVNSLSPHYS